MADNSESSSLNVVLGVLIAIVLLVGGYYFLKQNGSVGSTTTNIDMPDIKVEAPDVPNPTD